MTSYDVKQTGRRRGGWSLRHCLAVPGSARPCAEWATARVLFPDRTGSQTPDRQTGRQTVGVCGDSKTAGFYKRNEHEFMIDRHA